MLGLLFATLLARPVQVLGASLPTTSSLALSLDSSPSSGVVGYEVYYGTASGNYTSILALGNVATATISGPASGVTYYFAITAVNDLGQESDFSNEASYRLGVPSLQISRVAGGPIMLTAAGPAGHTYDIEATENFPLGRSSGRCILPTRTRRISRNVSIAPTTPCPEALRRVVINPPFSGQPSKKNQNLATTNS